MAPRRISALIAATALTFTMTACGSSDDDAEPTTTTPSASSTEDADDEVDPATFAAEATTICTSSFTGTGDFRAAIDAYFEAENAGDYATADEKITDILSAMSDVADDLEALTPPADVADAYSAAIAEIRRQVEAEEWDPPAFGDDLASIGVTGCL